MLVPEMLELLPSTPSVPPMWPSTPCHWMPNSATRLARTSTIRLSTSTCARRPSSLSITARIWRYSGGGALMMSELVLGSAWMMPPVEGCPALPALPDSAGALAPRPPVPPRPDCCPRPALCRPPTLPLPLPPVRTGLAAAPASDALPPLPPASAARSVVASFTASAFFR